MAAWRWQSGLVLFVSDGVIEQAEGAVERLPAGECEGNRVISGRKEEEE